MLQIRRYPTTPEDFAPARRFALAAGVAVATWLFGVRIALLGFGDDLARLFGALLHQPHGPEPLTRLEMVLGRSGAAHFSTIMLWLLVAATSLFFVALVSRARWRNYALGAWAAVGGGYLATMSLSLHLSRAGESSTAWRTAATWPLFVLLIALWVRQLDMPRSKPNSATE